MSPQPVGVESTLSGAIINGSGRFNKNAPPPARIMPFLIHPTHNDALLHNGRVHNVCSEVKL
jgi:hypothetical protein